MFSKLVFAGAAAIAIARPIKEIESFSAWKEEVSLNFCRRQNVIYYYFLHPAPPDPTHPTPHPLFNLFLTLLTHTLKLPLSFSLAYLIRSLKELKRPFLQMLKKQRHTIQMESQHGQQA